MELSGPSGVVCQGEFLSNVRETVVIGGVPQSSRHAHVMIDADYHMKKVCQGHARVSDVTSYLDKVVEQIQRRARAGEDLTAFRLRMSRFWFHVGQGGPTFAKAEGIVRLTQCPVVVLTEKQNATADGRLYDADEEDPIATAFAAEFSRHMSQAAQSVPVYADLENLYRLRALLLAMCHQGADREAGLDLGFFLRDYRHQAEAPMPQSLPGLTNR